jgi:hypothetical protein
MICPARIKNGMARIEKLSKPVTTRCAMVVSAGKVSTLTNRVSKDEIPKLHATGTLMEINTRKLSIRMLISIFQVFDDDHKVQKFIIADKET